MKIGMIPDELKQASGVTPLEGLDDDVVLLIGDKDLFVAQIRQSTNRFNTVEFMESVKSLEAELQGSIDVNDMEDIAWDKERRMAFVVVSGSKNSANEIKKKREKLVRLVFDEMGQVQPKGQNGQGSKDIPAFKSAIVAAFPELAPSVQSHVNNGGVGGTFNIEGTTLLPDGRLLLGFRSPLHFRDPNNTGYAGDAIVIALTNPHAIFDEDKPPKFEKEALYLPLDGQGIRGMFYDAERGGCWIVSGASANAVVVNAETWKLWFWDLKSPPVAKPLDTGGLKNAEGLCRMNVGDEAGLLFIEDAGKDENDQSLPCRYLLVPLPQ